MKLLKNLRLLRVSLVDKGSNPDSHVVISRSSKSTAEVLEGNRLMNLTAAFHEALWTAMEYEEDPAPQMRKSAEEFLALLDAAAPTLSEAERADAATLSDEVRTFVKAEDEEIIDFARSLKTDEKEAELAKDKGAERADTAMPDGFDRLPDTAQEVARGLPEDARAAYVTAALEAEEAKARAEQAEEVARKAEDNAKKADEFSAEISRRLETLEEEREIARFAERAKEFSGLPVESEKVSEVLRKAAKADFVGDLEDIFRTCASMAQTNMFGREKGSTGKLDSVETPKDQLERMAAALVEKGDVKDIHEARVKVQRTHPDLVRAMYEGDQ